ncbi:purine permease [Stachybotrys elegans]|uniref:Purine permease n=1 Tax=Stachybotrys elegans TaxID=80388 RepID=A0A8K0WU45_9HYPO|nr:purine permease [Stachybotrys elegans]
MDEDVGPQSIAPAHAPPRKTLAQRLASVRRALTTREGLVGDYDYAFLFMPNLPFMKRDLRPQPFFGLNDRLPLLLALLLGFQHSLAMLAGVITPSIILSGSGGANLLPEQQRYLVSASLIVSGIMSAVQITRFHIWKTPYYLGTGVISVLGISFTILPVGQGVLAQMYDNGYCPSDADGTPLPCPRGYGALIGTSAVCALLEVLISFIPPQTLLRIFPPIVSGPTVMLIGVKLIQSGFRNWMGGSGLCSNLSPPEFFARCPDITAPHALPWGSPEYIGLGFSVFAGIILCERFGSPIMKSTSVIWGLLVGCIIAAATGYFDRSGIDDAPAVSFLWVETFPLSVYAPAVLPILAVYVLCAIEAIGDITATCDVSRLEVSGKIYETRIQGGVLSDGLSSIFSALAGLTAASCFAQNNGVIAQTRVAARSAGYACCFFLIIMGIFSKFGATLVAIPASVLGGMTTFLFAAVAASGMAITSRGAGLNSRRSRFIVTAGLALGFAATLFPDWFSRVFSYEGDNSGLNSFLDAIVLVMNTGFAVCALVCTLLNFILPEEIEEMNVETVEEVRSDSDDRQNSESKEQKLA